MKENTGFCAWISDPSKIWISIWFVLNIILTLMNKGMMHFCHFTFPVALSFIHQSMSTFLSFFMQATGAIKFVEEEEQPPGIPNFEKKIMIRILSLSLLFTANIVFGNISLYFCSVSFVQIVRAIIPMVTMILSLIVLKSKYTLQHYLSCAVVCVGVCFSCLGESSHTTLGLFITIIGCVLSSSKSIFVKQSLGGVYKISSSNLLLRMSPVSAIEMFALSSIMGEPKKMVVSEKYTSNLIAILLILSTGVIAYFLNLTNFLATKYTSPLTVTIAGCVKQVVTIILSVLIFDKSITLLNALGIVITMAGSLWYSLLKFIQKKEEPKREDEVSINVNQSQGDELMLKDDFENAEIINDDKNES